jgi:hypothetical protein
MAEMFAVTQIPGAETGEIPPSPVDRDEKTAIIYSLVDPVWDIDVLPLTYTNSRWSAFFYRCDEKALRRVLPDCLDLEDDIVEFWYVDHNNTMLGPYGEMGVTVAASHKAGDGRTLYAGYYPYMYLTQDSAIDAGRVLGFPKKEAFIRVLEHGGAPDDGYGVMDGKNYQFDYFSFLMIRNGYVIHSATGKYDDADLSAKPAFYGNTDYGRMNMKVVTAPDLSKSEWQLVYLHGDQGPGHHDGSPGHRGLAPLPGEARVDPDCRTGQLRLVHAGHAVRQPWARDAAQGDDRPDDLQLRPDHPGGRGPLDRDLHPGRDLGGCGQAVPLRSAAPLPEAHRPRRVGKKIRSCSRATGTPRISGPSPSR